MRTFHSSPVSSAFGLVAWLEMTRVVLPLKGVECRFEVTGGVASVELDQIYHQENAVALDCTYLFPLPADAAVYRCELIVNGRVVRAIVEEEQAAKKVYAEKKAAGHRVAMVESERENLFTLTLGNVQPGDLVVVRLAWFQVLDRLGDGLRMLVPTCPGVRYIPGQPLLRSNSGRGPVDDTNEVPDASRITPPRIGALHPDAAYFALSGRLSRADAVSGSVSSPTHVLLVRETEEAVTVELADRGEVPDQDFILAWREPAARTLEPQAWRWEGDDGCYALVQLRAPEIVAVAENVAQDFYFLVDRSGSMQGRKWEQTCRALRSFVGLLGAEDRVWITLFESSFQDYAEKPLPAPQVRADANFQQMVKQGVAGGTELLPAAKHVLEVIARHSPGRTATVVLITDGEVGNDAQIIAAFRQAPEVRVHTFGIDTTVNDALLKRLAREHRGGCWLQSPHDNIAGTVAALGAQLRRPVITQLAIGAGWEAGATLLPDLHAGQVVTLPVRGDRAAALEITGRLANGETHRFAVPLETVGTSATQLLWARERMATLLTADRRTEAVALAKKSNLICEGAVFVAWDEAEKVTVAKKEVVQPAMETMKLCYGAPASYETARAYRAIPLEQKGRSLYVNKELGGMPEDKPRSAPRSPAPDEPVSQAEYGSWDGDNDAQEVAEKGTAKGWFSRLFGRGSGGRAGDGTRADEENTAEELWKNGVAPALARLGFPAANLDALKATLHEKGDTKSFMSRYALEMRMKGLLTSAEQVEQMIAALDTPAAHRAAEEYLQRTVPALVHVTQTLQSLVSAFSKLAYANKKLPAPPNVVRGLAEWVLSERIELGTRQKALDEFLKRVLKAPVGNALGTGVVLWQEFLDRSVGRDSAAYAAARVWMPELAPAAVATVG